MIFAPPRHGKSEELSRLFSAYYLSLFSDRWVGINSYAAELAYTLSRSSRENFIANGGVIKDDAAAVKHWETTCGGGLWAAGVGGPITGKGFHLGIIDDPLKNAQDAASELINSGQREWYSSTFYTREEPGGAIVIMMTRWNERDLAGWLLEQETQGEQPEGWHIVSFEAIKEADAVKIPATCTLEEDDREVGEPLCPERYPLAKLLKIANRIGAYFWNALYRQRPTSREGNMFKVAKLEIVDAAPAAGRRVRYWDKAATPDGGDFTAGVRMLKGPDGIFYVEDVARGQWSTDDRDATIKQTAQLDTRAVEIGGEQEPGASGVDAAKAFVRMLAGFTVRVGPASGSKEVRADPFSSQVNAGNVKLVRGKWNAAFIEELRQFPQGKHDDQIDGASGAFNTLNGGMEFKQRSLDL